MDRIKLVLLPGFDGTGKMFRPILPYLVSSFDPQVVTYPSTGPQDYSSLSNFVEAVLPKDQDFVLLGESFGGPIAVDLAAKQPPNLKGLILCASFLSAPRCIPQPLRRIISNSIFKFPQFDCVLRYFLLGTAADQELVSAMKASLAETRADALASRLEAILNVNVVERMRNVKVLTLCIFPTADKLIPKAVRLNLSSMTNKTVQIPGPHCVLQSEPKKSYETILEFCDTLYNKS